MNWFIIYLLIISGLMFLLFQIKNFSYQKEMILCLSILGILLLSIPTFCMLSLSLIINYAIAKQLVLRGRKWLIVGISYNVILLFSLKLIQLDSSNQLFIILGVSFFSLQHISYLYMVYRNSETMDFISFSLYIVYFPKFLSGPLEEPKAFLSNVILPTWKSFYLGIGRICLGLLKKFIIADRLAYSLELFQEQKWIELPGLTQFLSEVAYTIQLYFNFSAFIDIVIGSSLLIGIKLNENFNFPLRSTSITKFWQNWHITLMNWFRTYVYYPFAFRFRSNPFLSISLSVMLLFLISGIWHGLSITFIIWGLIHGLMIILESILKKRKSKIGKPFFLQIKSFVGFCYTFLVVVFANIFFHANSIKEALIKIKLIFNQPFWVNDFLFEITAPFQGGGLPFDSFNFKITLILLGIFLFFERSIHSIFTKGKYIFAVSIFTVILILIFGRLTDSHEFIYAQF